MSAVDVVVAANCTRRMKEEGSCSSESHGARGLGQCGKSPAVFVYGARLSISLSFVCFEDHLKLDHKC